MCIHIYICIFIYMYVHIYIYECALLPACESVRGEMPPRLILFLKPDPPLKN